MRNENPLSPAAIAGGLIVTIVGGIIVAILVGEGRFATTIPTVSVAQRDVSVSPSFTPAIMPPTPIPPKLITVTNQLLLPIKVYIDEVYKGQIEQKTTRTYLLDSFPVRPRWELVRTINPNGEPFGEMMAASYYPVYDGATIEVTNVIGNAFYFYPWFNNHTELACEISINDGYADERRPGTLGGYTKCRGGILQLAL